MQNIPMLDLRAQYVEIKPEIDAAVQRVFNSQKFILGSEVEEFEASVADYCGSRYAVGVSSGSDALLLSLLAEGIGKGDHVVTSPYTFFATAGAIKRVGAQPIFVDIDPETFNINTEILKNEITDRTKAIIPVHLFGCPADMETIMDIAEANDVVVIEDACQAIGAHKGGKKAGTIGHYGCLSFFPSKNLGGAGDGGMVLTQDIKRRDMLRALRKHGATQKYHHQYVSGGNHRLDALQAAVLNVKLRFLNFWTSRRQSNAKLYNKMLEGTRAIPPADFDFYHVYNQFVIRHPERDSLQLFLKSLDISTEVYYPLPLHLQPCFDDLDYHEGDLPESEKAAKETLALPIYPELIDYQIEHICEIIRSFDNGA